MTVTFKQVFGYDPKELNLEATHTTQEALDALHLKLSIEGLPPSLPMRHLLVLITYQPKLFHRFGAFYQSGGLILADGNLTNGHGWSTQDTPASRCIKRIQFDVTDMYGWYAVSELLHKPTIELIKQMGKHT